MTLAQQMLESLGLNNGQARRNFARAQRAAQRTTSRIASDVPLSYMWIGAAFVAGAALLLVRQAGPWRTIRVRDVMVDDVVTVSPTAPLLEAAQKMREGNVGILPVVENGILRGVLTDRDIVVRAVAQGLDPTTTRVTDVMTKGLASAHPDSRIDEAMRVMSECQIGRLPVVDQHDRLCGIVTLSSLALRSRQKDDALETAREVSRRSARIA